MPRQRMVENYPAQFYKLPQRELPFTLELGDRKVALGLQRELWNWMRAVRETAAKGEQLQQRLLLSGVYGNRGLVLGAEERKAFETNVEGLVRWCSQTLVKVENSSISFCSRNESKFARALDEAMGETPEASADRLRSLLGE